MLELVASLFTDYTLRNIALGSAILGVVSGVLGCFAVLRRQSLLGDTLAHAALPGLCIAFLLTGSKDPLVLLAGAAAAGWLAAMAILGILRNTRLPEDAALGVILSGFFGFGVALLTFIQNANNANQSGLDKFLFGQAATIVASDVVLMAVLGGMAVFAVGLLFKEFKILSFDPEYAASLGLPIRGLGVTLTSLVVVAVVVGLQTVGVVLMAAMLIAPAAAARQWTDNLAKMLVLSGCFGALAGVVGAVASASRSGLPTGPMVIVVISLITLLSLFLAPLRGLLWQNLRERQNRIRLRLERILLDAHVLFNHAELSPQNLAQRRRSNEAQATRELEQLLRLGWAQQRGGLWSLTAEGHEVAHRLEQQLRGNP